MKSNPFWKKLREYFSVYLPKQRNSSEKTIDTCHMAWNLLLRYLMQERGIEAGTLGFETFTAGLLEEFLEAKAGRKQAWAKFQGAIPWTVEQLRAGEPFPEWDSWEKIDK